MTDRLDAQDSPASGATAAPTLACDLVMKGGITSGVIYPKLVARLASRYRFRNIGGTSAGAIAAAACAAAEHGRNHGHELAFNALEKLTAELGATLPCTGRSKLFSLFQPTAALQQHFGVLAAALNSKPAVAAGRVLQAMLRMHASWVACGMLLGSLLLMPTVHSFDAALAPAAAFGMAALVLAELAVTAALVVRVALASGLHGAPAALLAAGAALALALQIQAALGIGWSWRLVSTALALQALALLVLALLIVSIAWRFGTTLLRGLHDNGYGLCSGRTAQPDAGGPEGLTDWLGGYLDGLAGLGARRRPLTFADLWGSDDPEAARDVNLEVMTSAVSQKMVYGIPFRKGSPRFHYDPDEWASLFPPRIMQWLQQAADETPEGGGGEAVTGGARVVSATGKALRPLPRSADLPVVVAVRLSLSFPLLLSAVPLYTVDWSRKHNQDQKGRLCEARKKGDAADAEFVASKTWFSDGGIGSNMPLHLFDALLPSHPTFAVNLKPQHPDFPIRQPQAPDNAAGRVYLPLGNGGGHLRHGAEPSVGPPLPGLASFLLSIVDTMQNWRDEILFPYPGFRDRIVQISLRPSEGGLNLDMPECSIEALSEAGALAASRLIDRFHPQGAENGRGWSQHRSVRLGTLLGTLQPSGCALRPLLQQGAWSACLAGIHGYRDAERQLADDFLRQLQTLGSLGADGGLSLERGALKPLAQLRIAPRI